MATTLDDSGIIFPDATTQTTAVDLTSDIDVTGAITADALTIDGAGIGSRTVSGTSFSISARFRPNGTDGLIDIGAISSSNGGDAYICSAYNDADLVFGTRSNSNNYQRLRIDGNGDVSFYEDTGSTTKFFWDASAERLGIGTTSPSTPLHIFAPTENVAIFERNGASPALIRLNDNSTTNDPYIGSYGNDLAFGTYGGGEKMRIKSSGNVGIGTTSPSQKLHVNGTVKATAFEGSGVVTVSSSDPATNTNGSLGDVYANSTTGEMYVCTDATSNSNIWRNVGSGSGDIEPVTYPTATGGTVTTSGNYKIHTFTSSGTFSVSNAGNQNTTMEIWVNGGGGGGGGKNGYGGDGGGGGGGAGMAYHTGKSISATSYSVTVGAGGAGSVNWGASGGASTFNGLTANGGGPGQSRGDGSGQNGAGGAGGTASGGTTNTTGQSGSGYYGGGSGGASYGTYGGAQVSRFSNGNNYGGGGSGATSGSSWIGGNGAGGVVVIKYQYQ